MKRLRFVNIVLVLALLGLASCQKHDPVPEQPAVEVYEQAFAFGTRADSETGYPVHGDPYTIVSYHVGGKASSDIDTHQIHDGKLSGYYAYDDGTLSGRPAGTLVPVEMNHPYYSEEAQPEAYPYPMYWPKGWTSPAALVKHNLSAQMLAAIPASGVPDPLTNRGIYRVAMIHPAVPMRSAAESSLGSLAVFRLGDHVYASMPDDLNGDGNQNDPFQITVTSNGQVHELPHVDLFPIESAIKVFFYSEYYAASDTEKTKPLSQTFSITSLRIHNVGSNGWYNARTGIVYPNYNYSYSFYNEHSTEEYGDYLPNNVEMTSTADNVTPGPGKAGNPIQWTAQTEIFPSDYRGAEGGGLAQVKPLILKVELDMTPDTGEEENQGDGTDEGEGTSETGEGETPGEGTDEGGGTPSAEEEGMTRSTGEVTNKVSIPIVPLALKVERGKRYNFYINVRSESIAITYTVSAWDADVSGDDIGGNQIDYATMPFTYSPTSGWENGGGGSDNIGGIQ